MECHWELSTAICQACVSLMHPKPIMIISLVWHSMQVRTELKRLNIFGISRIPCTRQSHVDNAQAMRHLHFLGYCSLWRAMLCIAILRSLHKGSVSPKRKRGQDRPD